MSTDQKFHILQAAAGSDTYVGMRKPGDWYVHLRGVGVKEWGGGVIELLYGNGSTPQEAIEDTWRLLVTELPENKYLVINAYSKDRKAVKWNGYMWEEITE